MSMPLYGLHTFPWIIIWYRRIAILCVNALIRASHISIGIRRRRCTEHYLCQCPYTGFTHFHAGLLELAVYAAFRWANSPKLSDNSKIALFSVTFWFFEIFFVTMPVYHKLQLFSRNFYSSHLFSCLPSNPHSIRLLRNIRR